MMLDLDGLDGVRADERRRADERTVQAPRAERARAITPPPLPDDAPSGAEVAPPADIVAPEADSGSLAPSLAPRMPRALWAAPVVIAAVVAVAWLVGARTRNVPIAPPPPAPPPVSRPIVTPLPAPVDAILPARFGFNERTPRGEAAEVAAIVARCGRAPLVLTGHADAIGSDRANDQIALARADAVRALLVAEGIDAARVRIASAGATQPIASNGSARGRRDNRRVTLHCEPHNGGEP